MIADDKWFYFVGGKKASNLEELKQVLRIIDEAEFVFHVNAGKNDFANWAEGVFQEKELADEMRKIFEKKRMIELLDDYHEKKSALKGVDDKDDLPVFGVKEVPGWDEVDTDKRVGDKSEELEETTGALYEKKEETIKAPEKPAATNNASSEWKAIEVQKIEPDASDGRKEGEGEILDDKNIADDGDDDLKRIVFDSRKIIKEEEARLSHKARPALPEPKFLVKEFIYGFIIGLIFGLIMLGMLLNLRP